MKNDQVVTDQSHKPRRAKSREVSSWFLSSPTTIETTTLPSPNHPILPVRRKPVSPFSDDRKPKTQLDDSGPTRGLWPSSNSSHKKLDTLADHLGTTGAKIASSVRIQSLTEEGAACRYGYSFSINSHLVPVCDASAGDVPIQFLVSSFILQTEPGRKLKDDAARKRTRKEDGLISWINPMAC
ncbi:hypothetical protein C1H46_018318 [Malus baccata]|uniref:Uncharacterized protein n=1 Tax=Malus baccata TaxID=106549 RepID=A0A540MBZ8_MALBA|nr:hypothetical protein C1H46_018318 [Malus baccata]